MNPLPSIPYRPITCRSRQRPGRLPNRSHRLQSVLWGMIARDQPFTLDDIANEVYLGHWRWVQKKLLLPGVFVFVKAGMLKMKQTGRCRYTFEATDSIGPRTDRNDEAMELVEDSRPPYTLAAQDPNLRPDNTLLRFIR